MTNTNTALPCNTSLDRARLRFIREARCLGVTHEVLEGRDQLEFAAAVRAADLELCLEFAMGVLVSLLTKSEREIAGRCGRWHTAAYLNLLASARAAGCVPHDTIACAA